MNDELMKRRIGQLTEAQKECLRLVWAHMTSKQIAREIGISYHTVDAHLKKANKTLGVSRRTEAASILARTERRAKSATDSYFTLTTGGYKPSSQTSPSRVSAFPDVDYAELVQEAVKQDELTAKDGGAPWIQTVPMEGIDGILGVIKKGRITGKRNTLPIHTRIAIVIFISILSTVTLLILAASMQMISGMYR